MLDMSVVYICKSDIVSYITPHTTRSLFGYNLLVILLLLSLILFFLINSLYLSGTLYRMHFVIILFVV